MEWNAQTMQLLSECFLNTLSPAPEPRRRAEAFLSEAADRPNFGLAVLRLVSEPAVDEQIRQSAAVHFKNHLKNRWSPKTPKEGDHLTLTPILQSEKEQIKSLIVPMMLASTPRIQSQLSEALAVIGNHDFPKLWPTLLPELVDSLRQANDYAVINGILGTANSIFKKFRYQYKTNELLLDLKYCLDTFAAPLLEIFLKTAKLVDSMGANAAVLRPLFESQRLCCRIFYSLNFQELPEFFEDHMKEWMDEFKKYLTTTYPALEEGGGDGLFVVDEVRAAVCENISLYMEKNEEEFQGYLNDFALAVWSLLGRVSVSSTRDRLTIRAIKFLTTVSTSVHHTLFAGANVIPQICQTIVIPNVRLRDEDEELFEMNYVEFIRRDMEGSDLDTRRRISCELLKGIATNYKEQVTAVVSGEINRLLAAFASNPSENWKEKDCAIYLVLSLANKKAGGSSVSTDLVNVERFYESHIGPELHSQDVNSFPMLKAGALKFFTMFRNQISKNTSLTLVPQVIRFLLSESNVVHSYSATCIERLLTVKDETGRAMYTSVDINPFLDPLIPNLFKAFKFPESEENSYLMKCVMRVLGIANITREIAVPCITELRNVLDGVCRNPKNPVFNHYLFESVAVLVRRACQHDSSLISVFEVNLFPSLETILAQDVTEFFPYAFQLLAQLVELNQPPLPPHYMQIFQLLLSPESWKRAGNVPALVRLLQAFLKKAPSELNQEGRLGQVLGIYSRLISSSNTDDQGFYILNTIIENLEYDVIAPFVPPIWTSLFHRLNSNRTVKFIKSFLIFMSLFVVKFGSSKLVETMNGVQANIFLVILEQFWIPNLKLISGAIELKLAAIASTKLLCESPVLLDVHATTHWGKLLDSIVILISRPEQDRLEEEPEIPDLGENVGYTAAFVRLYNAGRAEEDPLSDIRDPKEYIVASLAELSARFPGRFPRIIGENLDPTNQGALLQLCHGYSRNII